MVPLLSSAARMPLPGATRARAVAASSSVIWNLPLGSGPLQYPGEAAVGRVAQAARLPAEEADLDGQLGADEHRGRVAGAGSPGPGRDQRPPSRAEGGSANGLWPVTSGPRSSPTRRLAAGTRPWSTRPQNTSPPGRPGSGRPTSRDLTWSWSGTKPPTRNVSRW